MCASALQRALWDSLSERYPSLITMQLLPRVTDPAPARRMIGCLLSSIKSCGEFPLFRRDERDQSGMRCKSVALAVSPQGPGGPSVS